MKLKQEYIKELKPIIREIVGEMLKVHMTVVPDSNDQPDNSGKPDWKDAPDWAEWLAMDEDGEWCWFRDKPDQRESLWGGSALAQDCIYAASSEGFPINWKETLECRPQKTQDIGPGWYPVEIDKCAMGTKRCVAEYVPSLAENQRWRLGGDHYRKDQVTIIGPRIMDQFGKLED